MKRNIYWGDLTDTSARTNTLPTSRANVWMRLDIRPDHFQDEKYNRMLQKSLEEASTRFVNGEWATQRGHVQLFRTQWHFPGSKPFCSETDDVSNALVQHPVHSLPPVILFSKEKNPFWDTLIQRILFLIITKHKVWGNLTNTARLKQLTWTRKSLPALYTPIPCPSLLSTITLPSELSELSKLTAPNSAYCPYWTRPKRARWI